MSAIENLINEKIELRQHDHQYILHSNPNIQFSSVTNIIDDHFKPFDKWRIARILTTNNSKYQHLTPEELVGQWNEVRDHGSRVHDEIEKFITSKTPPQYEESRHALKALDSIKKNVGCEWLPEVIVFSKKLKVAGSVDLIVKHGDSFSIYDWKTTKNIYKDNGGYGTSTQTKSMRDTNFNKYELQLSGYSYLLEQCHDIKIKNQYIVHLTKNDFEIISTENKRKLIRSIFGKIKNKTVSKKKEKVDANLRKNYQSRSTVSKINKNYNSKTTENSSTANTYSENESTLSKVFEFIMMFIIGFSILMFILTMLISIFS